MWPGDAAPGLALLPAGAAQQHDTSTGRGACFSHSNAHSSLTYTEKMLVPMALVKKGFYVGAGGVNQLQKLDFGKTSFHPPPQELPSHRSFSVESTQALQYSGIKLLKHCGIKPRGFLWSVVCLCLFIYFVSLGLENLK